MRVFYSIFIVFIFNLNCFAFTTEEHLTDQIQEERAQKLFTEIRCLVCEAQSIESSDTAFSASLRKIIRQKILQNKSDEEIKNELYQEFGDKILMSSDNYFSFAWLAPIIFALILLLYHFNF